MDSLTDKTSNQPFIVERHRGFEWESFHKEMSEYPATIYYESHILKPFQHIISQTKLPGTAYFNPYLQIYMQFPADPSEFTVWHLQILARNEYYNTNGVMETQLNPHLTANQLATIRCLVKQTIIAGNTLATRVMEGNISKPLEAPIPCIALDQIGFQWQGDYRNTGGLFFYPNDKTHRNLPEDYLQWQKDTYQSMFNEERPDSAANNSLNVTWKRYRGDKGVKGHINLDALEKAFAQEFEQALCVSEKEALRAVVLRYLKAGLGFFASGLGDPVPVELELARLRGICSVLEKMDKNKFNKIEGLMLPYSAMPSDKGKKDIVIPELQTIQKAVENKLEWQGAGASEYTKLLYFVSTFCADPHCPIVNEGHNASTDAKLGGCIQVASLVPANNLSMQFCPMPTLDNLNVTTNKPTIPLTTPLQQIQLGFQCPDIRAREAMLENLKILITLTSQEPEGLIAHIDFLENYLKDIMAPEHRRIAAKVFSTNDFSSDNLKIMQLSKREKALLDTYPETHKFLSADLVSGKAKALNILLASYQENAKNLNDFESRIAYMEKLHLTISFMEKIRYQQDDFYLNREAMEQEIGEFIKTDQDKETAKNIIDSLVREMLPFQLDPHQIELENLAKDIDALKQKGFFEAWLQFKQTYLKSSKVENGDLAFDAIRLQAFANIEIAYKTTLSLLLDKLNINSNDTLDTITAKLKGLQPESLESLNLKFLSAVFVQLQSNKTVSKIGETLAHKTGDDHAYMVNDQLEYIPKGTGLPSKVYLLWNSHKIPSLSNFINSIQNLEAENAVSEKYKTEIIKEFFEIINQHLLLSIYDYITVVTTLQANTPEDWEFLKLNLNLTKELLRLSFNQLDMVYQFSSLKILKKEWENLTKSCTEMDEISNCFALLHSFPAKKNMKIPFEGSLGILPAQRQIAALRMFLINAQIALIIERIKCAEPSTQYYLFNLLLRIKKIHQYTGEGTEARIDAEAFDTRVFDLLQTLNNDFYYHFSETNQLIINLDDPYEPFASLFTNKAHMNVIAQEIEDLLDNPIPEVDQTKPLTDIELQELYDLFIPAASQSPEEKPIDLPPLPPVEKPAKFTVERPAGFSYKRLKITDAGHEYTFENIPKAKAIYEKIRTKIPADPEKFIQYKEDESGATITFVKSEDPLNVLITGAFDYEKEKQTIFGVRFPLPLIRSIFIEEFQYSDYFLNAIRVTAQNAKDTAKTPITQVTFGESIFKVHALIMAVDRTPDSGFAYKRLEIMKDQSQIYTFKTQKEAEFIYNELRKRMPTGLDTDKEFKRFIQLNKKSCKITFLPAKDEKEIDVPNLQESGNWKFQIQFPNTHMMEFFCENLQFDLFGVVRDITSESGNVIAYGDGKFTFNEAIFQNPIIEEKAELAEKPQKQANKQESHTTNSLIAVDREPASGFPYKRLEILNDGTQVYYCESELKAADIYSRIITGFTPEDANLKDTFIQCDFGSEPKIILFASTSASNQIGAYPSAPTESGEKRFGVQCPNPEIMDRLYKELHFYRFGKSVICYEGGKFIFTEKVFGPTFGPTIETVLQTFMQNISVDMIINACNAVLLAIKPKEEKKYSFFSWGSSTAQISQELAKIISVLEIGMKDLSRSKENANPLKGLNNILAQLNSIPTVHLIIFQLLKAGGFDANQAMVVHFQQNLNALLMLQQTNQQASNKLRPRMALPIEKPELKPEKEPQTPQAPQDSPQPEASDGPKIT